MYNEMENDILKVLFSQEDIARRVAEMGTELAERFPELPVFTAEFEFRFAVAGGHMLSFLSCA